MTKTKKKGAKPKTRTRASRTGTQPISRSLGMTSSAYMLAKAIHDPCGGPLIGSVDNVGSASIVERVRRTFDVTPGASNVHGYIIWYPAYHGTGSYGGCGNLYHFATSTFTNRPLNTVLNPAGTNSVDTTGMFYSDPCLANLSSDAFSRGRSVSACIQMDYVGALASMQGQIAVVKNFSLQAFDQATGLGNLTFPTPSEIFNYAQSRQRVTGEGVEVVWRPSSNGSIMRGHGPITTNTISTAAVPDHVFTIGNPTFFQTSISCPEVGVPNGICIAWSGIPPNQNFIISCIKTVELELSIRNNAIEAPMSSTIPREPGLIEKATAILDSSVPGWQTRAIHAAMRGAATLLERAYGPRNRSLLRAPNVMGLIRDRDL